MHTTRFGGCAATSATRMRPRLNAPTRMRHLSRWPRLAFTPLCTVQIAPLRSHLAHALRLLPISVHGRVTDIWRAYFTQRLLWGCGYRVAFAYPWVTQYRNAPKWHTALLGAMENPKGMQSLNARHNRRSAR